MIPIKLFLARVPSWAWETIIGTLFVVGCYCWHLFAMHGAYTNGFNKAVKDRATSDSAEIVRAAAYSAQKEAVLRNEISKGVDERSLLKAENEKYKTDIDARITAGTERLRCPAAPVRGQTAPASPATASGPAAAQGEYVVPEVALDVLSIARDSAQNVWDYNSLVKQYNDVVTMCNGK